MEFEKKFDKMLQTLIIGNNSNKSIDWENCESNIVAFNRGEKLLKFITKNLENLENYTQLPTYKKDLFKANYFLAVNKMFLSIEEV